MIGAAVALAVGLGLRARSKGGLGGGSPAATTPGSTTTSTGGFDSSSSDVYNALQPQIEQTQTMLQKLIELLTGTPVVAKPPVVTPPKTTPPVVAKPPPVVLKEPPGPRAPPKPAPHKPVKKVYIVRKGDTLSTIALRLHIPNWHTLYTANRAVIGLNANLIKPGQRLVY